MMFSLPDFSVKRPVCVFICLVSLILFGVSSVFEMPLESTPEMNMPTMTIMTSYPDASPDEVDEMVTNALKLIRTLGLIGSGLSFAIGTLGILSIMTLLVRSRRLEIGMRRVVGATRKKILLQFIAEAAFLSTAGGLSGVATALFLCALIVLFGLLPGYFSASITLGVLILSILCGILAGAYPAWKAAHTDVLQTLRDL